MTPNKSAELKLHDNQIVVFVPPGCVKLTTTLTISTLNKWTWQDPFKITFCDGQQPMRPVEVFVLTTGGILNKRIVLSYLPNYEKGGNEEEFVDNAYFEEDGEDPDPKLICALISHFSWFTFAIKDTRIDFNALNIAENRVHSREWNGHNEGLENIKTVWERRGYVLPYLLPCLNSKSKAIQIDHFDRNWDDNIAILYHATEPHSAQSILQQGFKLPSERGGVCPGHIPLGGSHFGVQNWADAVFGSVSSKHVLAPAYAGQSTLRVMAALQSIFVMCGMVTDNKVAFTLLQCRVKEQGLTKVPASTNDGAEPGTFAFPGTLEAMYNKCDARMANGLQNQMECRVHDVNSIKPYRMVMGFIRRSKLRTFFKNPNALELEQ